MLEVVVRRGIQELISLPLDGERVRIGRSPMNDIVIPDTGVSRYQCELVRHETGWALIDRSGKGTVVDGDRHEKHTTKAGSRIELGNLELTIQDRQIEKIVPINTSVSRVTKTVRGDSTKNQSTEEGGEQLELVCRVGGWTTKVELVPGTTINIGKDEGNHLVLDDRFVSAFHCRICETKGRWWLEDLGSTNGTRINSVMAIKAALEPGQNIEIGKTVLTVQKMGADRDPKHVGFHGIVSVDSSMSEVFDRLTKFASSEEPILILGETGTGKELIAKAAFELSNRTSNPYLALNCSALSSELVESELFGHKKGSFTGATADRQGLFSEADGGTLFLDEVGELALEHQAKLLRVLEYGEVRRVGENRPHKVNTRIIAATQRRLPELVAEKKFREDLYYRLATCVIELPALRDRPADIPLLANYFLELATRHTSPKTFTASALSKLAQYNYPGNVRDLRNTVFRAAMLSTTAEVGPEAVEFKSATLDDMVEMEKLFGTGMRLADVEREMIRRALILNNFQKSAAAKQLDIARTTLQDKIRKYGLG